MGLDQANSAIRTLAVERIRTVIVTRSRFTPPPAESLDEIQSTAFQLIHGEPQLVRIRFSPEQALYIAERQWHPSQSIENQPDGGVILSLHVASLWEVQRWLIGWGRDALVLEPTALRTAIREQCQSVLSLGSGTTSDKQTKRGPRSKLFIRFRQEE
jgi:predicted DNA-binding transcriptional regulator YafY